MAQVPKKKLTVKQRMTIVYIAMGAIVMITIIGKLFKGKESFTLEEVLANKITTSDVQDRSLVGNHQYTIRNADSVAIFLDIIKMSKPVEFSSLNIKIGAQTCLIILKDASGKEFSTVLTDESKDKGILRSGEYFYRNDDLLNVIETKLKATPAIH